MLWSDRPPRRQAGAVIGFATGFAMTFVAVVLALTTPAFEVLLPLLVPATVLLRPVADVAADWNGLVTMLLTGVVNGASYAVVFVGVVAVTRRRTSTPSR